MTTPTELPAPRAPEPLRIALVSPYDFAYPGGVTYHVMHLDECFREAGHQVTIIAPASKTAEEIGYPHLRVIGKPVSIPAAGSVARVTLSLRLAKQVKDVLAEGNFDIVHLHEPLLPALPITVLRFSDSINVGTFHAHSNRNWGYFYGRRILKRWFGRLDGKIAVSRSAEEFASRYFPGYYNIIPNGIDFDMFSTPVATPSAALTRFQDGKLNILFMGRMEQRKGLKYLLRAFAYVKRQFPDARLIVCGAFDPHSRLAQGYKRSLAQSGVTDVEWVGWVDREEQPGYYQVADVFCAPSTGSESFGLILLEAMAAGKPVVASNIQGYAGVVTHGVEGFLVPPKDEQELALTLVHLLANPELRGRLGEAGRIRARDYNWDRVSRRVLAYYQRLLSEYQPKPREARPGLLRSSMRALWRYRPSL